MPRRDVKVEPGTDVNKKSDKSGKKNSQLVLRLDKDERDAFVDLCNTAP